MYLTNTTESNSTTTTQVIDATTVKIQQDRGILCVYTTDGTPLLKVTGLPRQMRDLVHSSKHEHELTIDIIPPDEAAADGRYVAAVEEAQHPPGSTPAVLKMAGATTPPHHRD